MKYDIKVIEITIEKLLENNTRYHPHACDLLNEAHYRYNLYNLIYLPETKEENIELKLFVDYFKPKNKLTLDAWFGSRIDSPQNQTDRYTALLFLLEIAKDLNKGKQNE